MESEGRFNQFCITKLLAEKHIKNVYADSLDLEEGYDRLDRKTSGKF